jgi:hypothetical protein
MEKNKLRLQFDADEETVREINDLQKITGLRTRAELVRQALRILRWILEEIKNKGTKFLIERDGKIHEIVFPLWGSDR